MKKENEVNRCNMKEKKKSQRKKRVDEKGEVAIGMKNNVRECN